MLFRIMIYSITLEKNILKNIPVSTDCCVGSKDEDCGLVTTLLLLVTAASLESHSPPFCWTWLAGLGVIYGDLRPPGLCWIPCALNKETCSHTLRPATV